MAPGIGASGVVGIALETVSGTYEAPTKFIPVNNESLQYMGEPQYRRPIRESADVIWAVPGDTHVEGDIEMDALDDCLPYFFTAARATVVKTGTTPNWIYTITPTAAAVPVQTLSITVVRNGLVFGFVGCVVSSFRFALSDGVLGFNVSIVGADEATEAAPVTTWGTTTPYGAGSYDIEIPTSTPVLDTDTFEFTIEDNAEPQFRAKSTGRGAQFVKYGERNVGLTLGRDFESKVDFNAFKALTSQSITLKATKGVNNNISMLIPVAIKNSYEVGLSGQGDLLRGNIAYTGILGSPSAYQLVVKTLENLT